jgi:hypothetical protein
MQYVMFLMNKIINCFFNHVLANTVIHEMSARRHFSHMNPLFVARATKERVLHLRECAEYVWHQSSYNIF